MTSRSASRTRNEVRIVGGVWKRSKLPVPDKPGLRPTPDRVRETLFNWLGRDLSGWRCLDAFAGSGALGFEAASRGAAEVVLLECDPELVRGLKASRERLKADVSRVRIEHADATSWMARTAPCGFDLVLLDPPFGAALFTPALRSGRRLVTDNGLVYLEAPKAWDDEALGRLGLALHRHARAGAVHYHLLRPAGTLPSSDAEESAS
ncbi:MAG TPA: 16S rRNA (guanine(966)-N(2))-methyltransferase RsmD [Burkholderiaceae bacterium]|nr:16S rRNA (guanine(966)-N(2))-methyltransferase RsmD [Burkholderiaceae bacterium]